MARKADVQLILDTPAKASQAHADAIQISQVLTNLVRNAIEAASTAPPERRDVRVEITAHGDECLDIAVIDHGPGLAAEELNRVFEPFYTTKVQGMGMGLSICRTIVESHGGELVAESQPGSGSTFVLRLPAVP